MRLTGKDKELKGLEIKEQAYYDRILNGLKKNEITVLEALKKANDVKKAFSLESTDAISEADRKSAQGFLDIQNQVEMMRLQGKEKALRQLEMDERGYRDRIEQMEREGVFSLERAELLKALIKQTYAAKTMEVEKTLYGAEAKMVEQLVSEFEDLVQITEDWKLEMKSVGDIFRDMMNWFLRSFLKAGFLSLFTGNPLMGIGGTLATVFGGAGKMVVPNPAPMQALTQGPLPVLTAAAKRSILIQNNYHFDGTFLEPEKWIKQTLVPVQRRIDKQKLTGEGE